MRYTIDLSKELHAEIKGIARNAGMSMPQLFRTALGLFKVTHQAIQQGEHVGVGVDKQSLSREFVII